MKLKTLVLSILIVGVFGSLSVKARPGKENEELKSPLMSSFTELTTVSLDEKKLSATDAHPPLPTEVSHFTFPRHLWIPPDQESGLVITKRMNLKCSLDHIGKGLARIIAGDIVWGVGTSLLGFSWTNPGSLGITLMGVIFNIFGGMEIYSEWKELSRYLQSFQGIHFS